MDFSITPIKRLYKKYYRLFIYTDNIRSNTFIDIEPQEFIKLAKLINERIEMDSLDTEIIE